jgi:AcrR family transcriptional regulator
MVQQRSPRTRQHGLQRRIPGKHVVKIKQSPRIDVTIGAHMDVVESAIPVAKQARSELSTAKLLDAASELISESGYERMTLVAIGERAGYSHGLVTRRFGSKEGLLWALVEKMVVTWNLESLTPTQGKTAAEALHLVVDELRGSVEHSSGRMKTLYALTFEALTPIPELRERMRELHRDMRQYVRGVVADGIAAGSVSASVDPRVVAELFIGALRGVAYQWLLDPEEIDIDSALVNVDVLIDALLPPTPPPLAR